jgi:hypothetical protein
MPRMNVEEALRAIREKATLLRYVASAASVNSELPDEVVLRGFSDLCDEIGDLSRAITDVVGVTALDVELKRRR